MKRSERVLIHKKQERGTVQYGKPKVRDLQEGVLTLRRTDEGLVLYVRHHNQLFKRVFIRDNEEEGITIITD